MKRKGTMHIIISICIMVIVVTILAIICGKVFIILDWIHDAIYTPEKNIVYILYLWLKQAIG